MAYLIETGQLEAIPKNAIQLETLHSADVLQFDQRVTDIKRRNGGYANLLFELRRAILTRLRIEETYPLSSKESA